jgi:hypothetical protein
MTNGAFNDTGAATNSETQPYIRMDLGASYAVASVIIGTATSAIPGGWNRNYTSNKSVEYSADGTNWTLAFTTPSYAADGIYTETVSFTARYIRLTAPSGYLAMSEFYALAAGQTYAPNAPVLLIHFDGADGSTSFPLSATRAITSSNSGAVISTTRGKFGGSSVNLGGNGECVNFSGFSTYSGSQDFTAECWVYRNSGRAEDVVKYGTNGTLLGFKGSPNLDKLYTNIGGVDLIASATTPRNQWAHIAITRTAGTVRLFSDGALVATSGSANTTPIQITSFGQGGTGNNSFWGNADAFRVGPESLYTANFTAPTVAPQDSTFLLHMDGTNGSTIFTDSSKNRLAPTAVGSSAISTAASKFGGSSMGQTGVSYVSVPANDMFAVGSDLWSIDCWARWNAGGNWGLFSTGCGNFGLLGDGDRWVLKANGGNVFVTSWGPTANVWYHVAIVRRSADVILYIDGTPITVTPISGSFNVTDSSFKIGAWSSYYFNGYIDEFRFVRGANLFPSNFTPPTAPYTA